MLASQALKEGNTLSSEDPRGAIKAKARLTENSATISPPALSSEAS